MSTKKRRFIVLKKNIKSLGKKISEKDDIGFIESQNNRNSEIFFIRSWKNLKINNQDFEIFDVTKTGDAFEKKVCNVCHKRVEENFSLQKMVDQYEDLYYEILKSKGNR